MKKVFMNPITPLSLYGIPTIFLILGIRLLPVKIILLLHAVALALAIFQIINDLFNSRQKLGFTTVLFRVGLNSLIAYVASISSLGIYKILTQ